ncbi:MAG: EpsG family protein, partial [Terracidiphilus sp.]
MSEVQTLNLSHRAFDILMQPACVSGGPRFFMLCAALALPGGLLLFANWSRLGTLTLSCALIVSTVGFELMTNALRQGVSLSFLLAGFYFERRLFKFGALAIAMLLHDSSWFFAPLAVLIAYLAGNLTRKTLFLWGIPALLGLVYLLFLRFFSTFGQLSALLTFYTKSYAEKPSLPFLI